MPNDSVTRFVIFAAPRTGSNLLCSMLNSHPGILCHHGVFNPAGIHYALDHRSGDIDCGSIAERDLDPEGFLARLWRHSARKPVVGFKLNRGENEVAARAVLCDPGIRKILLSRRNRIKTYVSEKIAVETGEWESYGSNLRPGPKVHVQPEALREHITGNRQYYAEIKRALRISGQSFLEISYESLAPGEGGQERLLAFLGCPTARLTPMSVKRNPDYLREAIANFDELAGALRGTEVEKELYRLDSPQFSEDSRSEVGIEEGTVSANAIARAAANETSKAARFERHRGPVTSVAVLPGNRCAVATAYDGAVALFDLESGAVNLLGYHRHLANHIAVSRQGTKAASSSSDYDIYIWDIASRSLQTVLRGHSDDVECFAFVDDKTGVSVSRDHRVLVWNLATGAIRHVIDEHEKDVLSVTCWNGCIYSAGDDMTLRQWDLESGRLVRKWGPFEHETDTCAIDPVHSRAVLGCDDGVIRIFDSRSGHPIREIAAHASGIKKVAVSPVTGAILSAAYDQKIRIWDADSFALKVEMEPLPSKWERSFNWSPDGASIVAGTFDGTVAVWDADTGRLLQEVGRGAGPAGNACFNEVSASAEGLLALVSDDGYIRTVRLTPEVSELLAVVEPASGRTLMNAVNLDTEFGLVVAGAHDHRLHIFDHTPWGLAREREVALGEGPINSIRVARCGGFAGEIFAACYSGAVVRVRRDGAIAAKLAIHNGAVKALRIHPVEPIGVSCSADGALLSWTLDGTVLRRFPGHTSIVDDVDFDPASECIASVSRDFTLQVYRLGDGQLLDVLTLGKRSPKSVCFWDRHTVVVGDYWGALVRVDLPSRRITRNTIARNGLSSLARSNAGLLATSYDGGVYLVAPSDLSVRNVYRAMTQRLAP